MIKTYLSKIVFVFPIIFSVLLSTNILAQDNVGIGTNTPDPSAVVEMTSGNKGILVPRLTALQRLAIAAPANSLLVYDTDSMCYFFFRQPTSSWISLCNMSGGAAGAVGPTGAPGTAGTNGTTGATGIAGNNGIDGVTGATGTAGTNGIDGATGPTGAAGTNGINGNTGDIGATGAAGINGVDGVTGATGTAGTNGTDGVTGATGTAGTNGIDGITGATGTAGINGIDGATGATGAAGTNGTNGINGTTGATGATGIIQRYHVYGTAGRLAVNSATATLQPGLTQTFTLTAPATVIVWATIGARTTGTGNTNYANVDAIIYVDGAFLPLGGWNRFQVTNPSASNSFNTCAINTSFTLAAGVHTIQLRTARLAGSTSTVDIGGNAALDTNPGEMTILILN
jgi:hypothetical protein